jgi:hypothetical protein
MKTVDPKIETDAARIPWKTTRSSVVDADGQLVCTIARRLLWEPRWAALISVAPQLYDAFCLIEDDNNMLTALSDEVRTLFDEARTAIGKADALDRGVVYDPNER